MAVGKNIMWNKRERVSNTIFSIILRLLGRITKGEEVRKDGNFREENKVFKKWWWGRISSFRE